MDGDPSAYYVRHLPWLAGSLCCLLLDAFVFVQYFRYRSAENGNRLSIKEQQLEDDDTLPIIIDQEQQQENNSDLSPPSPKI